MQIAFFKPKEESASVSEQRSKEAIEQKEKPRRLKKFIDNKIIPTIRTCRKAFRAFENEFGIKIAKQSADNIQRIKREIDDLNKEFESDEKKSDDVQFPKLNTKELALKKVWDEKITPLFTLKHGTAKVFETLSPLMVRREEEQTVTNSHTYSKESLQRFSYFVLGIGDKHQTPNFLGGEVDVILIKLGELEEAEQFDFRGLFISNHISEFIRSERMPPVRFGATTRQVIFDKDTLTKTYIYQYSDGSTFKRVVHFQDEIFAEDGKIKTLFEALFLQFVLELKYMPDFAQYVYENIDNIEVIKDAFHQLFPSWVYPEAKMPLKMRLDKKYVSVQKRREDIVHLKKRWFAAAKKGNIEKLKQVYSEAKGSEELLLNAADKDKNATALMRVISFAIDDEPQYIECFNFLLQCGVDITLRDKDDDENENNALDRAISIGDLAKVETLVAGVKHARLPIRQLCDFQHPHVATTFRSSLIHAIQKDRGEIILFLLSKLTILPEDSPIIAYAYKYLSDKNKEKILPRLFELKANANVRDETGQTALMYAARINDLKYVTYFVEQKCEIDLPLLTLGNEIGPEDGQTALSIAAQEGHLATVEYLASQSTNLESTDFRGDSPYFKVLTMLQGGYALFYSRRYGESEEEKFISKYFRSVPEESEEEQYQAEWVKVLKGLEAVKDFLESNNVNKNTPQKTALQKCKHRYLNCVAIITGTISGESVFIMGRKKDDFFIEPTGRYLFPGGEVEKTESFKDAVIREVGEETGISIEHTDMVEVFVQAREDKKEDRYIETRFFHVDLGEGLSKTVLKAGSDLISLCFIRWKDVIQRKTGEYLGYFYKGIRLTQSNALLVKSILEKSKIDEEKVSRVLRIESEWGLSCFMQAVENEDSTAITQLVVQGLDINKTKALIRACSKGKTDVAILLLKLGANVNQVLPTAGGIMTPLITCIENKHTDLAKSLIEIYYANINIYEASRSPLTVSCRVQDEAMVSYLLKRGAELSQGIGGAALIASIEVKNHKLIQLLLATDKIDVNEEYEIGCLDGNPRMNPLMLAVSKGDCEMVRMLLEKGADIYFLSDRPSIFNNISSLLAKYLAPVHFSMFNLVPYPEFKSMIELILNKVDKNPPSNSHVVQAIEDMRELMATVDERNQIPAGGEAPFVSMQQRIH